jgi:two-component system nitrogen regulation response regulator GlnG
MRWVEEGKGDVVITDVMMPDGNGIEMIPKIGQDRPDLPVIVISAQNTIMTAIQAAEVKAFDYLPKPFDLPDLMKRVARALAQRAPHKGTAAPVAEVQETGDLPLVGKTPAMQQLYRVVAQVVNADLPVMITGESGVGKSLLARSIHDFSDRRSLPFVSVTASDLTDIEGPARVLAKARGGTILVEELPDLSAELQARLLRMMDNPGEYTPRFLATAQTDLAGLMADGRLRSDLYYRLTGALVHLPPLRERVDDVDLLCSYFLTKETGQDGAARPLSDEALKLFRGYSWPGNVRQLENTLRRLSLSGRSGEVTRAEAELVLGGQPQAAPVLQGGQENEQLSAAVARHLQRYFDLHGPDLPPPGVYARILREIEAPLITIALDATAGNQAKCADLLGINRNTLRKKIADLDLEVTRKRKLM